jgi:hypothetical protein
VAEAVKIATHTVGIRIFFTLFSTSTHQSHNLKLALKLAQRSSRSAMRPKAARAHSEVNLTALARQPLPAPGELEFGIVDAFVSNP